MMIVRNGGSGEEVASRFAHYLRGPKGRSVMRHLEEGESFIVQTSEHRLLVMKKNGQPQVSNLDAPMA